jgi:hypothetical protein
MRRQQQIDGQDAVLSPAFDDVAGLDKYLVVADVLHRQLVHATRLTHFDAPLGDRLFQAHGNSIPGRRTMQEVDRQVAMDDRAGNAETVGSSNTDEPTGSNAAQHATNPIKVLRRIKSLHCLRRASSVHEVCGPAAAR